MNALRGVTKKTLPRRKIGWEEREGGRQARWRQFKPRDDDDTASLDLEAKAF